MGRQAYTISFQTFFCFTSMMNNEQIPVQPSGTTNPTEKSSIPVIVSTPTITPAPITINPVVSASAPIPVTFTTPTPITVSAPVASTTIIDLPAIYNSVAELQKKIDEMYLVVDKMRKASVRSMWINIIFVVLPIALSIFALPFLMRSFLSTTGMDTSASSIQKLLEQVKSGQSGGEQ